MARRKRLSCAGHFLRRLALDPESHEQRGGLGRAGLVPA